MKLINKPNKIVVDQINNIIHLDWQAIEVAVGLFHKKIEKISPFDSLLVLVRGAMVPAAMLSHSLNNRNMKFYQGVKTNSNKPHDYGKFRSLLLPKLMPGERLLIVEDIIFEGDTVNNAIDYVIKCGCVCVGVCSIVIDENLKNLPAIKRNSVPLIGAYECENLKWIRFPWEIKIDNEISINF
jgi:orotate phosphoribosyltransferase